MTTAIYILNLLLYFFHFKISLFSDIKMLVPTFVGVYLQIYNQHAGGDSLCVILCVCANFACCLVAFQNLADVKQSFNL